MKDNLVNTKLAIPLLVLIAQQRSSIIFKTESSHLKLIGDLYDKVRERKRRDGAGKGERGEKKRKFALSL